MQHPHAKKQDLSALKAEIGARLGVNAAKDHLGDKEYNTFAGWKAACRKVAPSVWFEGDKDIGEAFVGPKPYKKGETQSIGQWGGDTGTVYKNAAETVKKVGDAAKPDAKASLRALRDDATADILKASNELKLEHLVVDTSGQTITAGAGTEQVKLRVLSHMRLHADDVEAAASTGRASVAAKMTKHFTPEILAKIVLADAANRLLSMELAGPLDDAAKQQIGRMIDSVELQLSLEIDRLERMSDTTPNPDAEHAADLLDTIMRGSEQERIDAVEELYANPKQLNMVTAAHLVRVLTSIHQLVQQAKGQP
jgi:hypothetical protein